jgi:hypothetical protein
MTGFTDYLELELLDHVLGNSAFTSQATYYLGLSTTVPNDDGTNVTEPSGFNYSRKAIASSDWTTAASGSIENTGAIVLPSPSGSWGTIIAFILSDASTGGNLITWGTVPSISITSGPGTYEIDAGDLVVTLD